MRYEKILMDIDDTIFDFQAGNKNAVEQLMGELGLSSPTVFEEYQVINHACWQALERGEMTQEVLHVERFRRFLAQKGRDDDPRPIARRFAELLGAQAIPMENAMDVMRELCEKRPVVLLTNGITVIQKKRLERSELKDWIQGIVISQEAGVAKPDPRIFQMALGETKPERALMVGDSAQSDIKGANLSGIDACWFNPKGKSLPEGVSAQYEIRELTGLLEIALQ